MHPRPIDRLLEPEPVATVKPAQLGAPMELKPEPNSRGTRPGMTVKLIMKHLNKSEH
jgi:hypothetical protein